MSGLFGGSTPATPPMPPPAKETEQSTDNAASAEKIRLMRAMGRQSTILGQNQGTGGAKTLLGG
jgi:hypothetical protein